jgi:hypothetical protein
MTKHTRNIILKIKFFILKNKFHLYKKQIIDELE